MTRKEQIRRKLREKLREKNGRAKPTPAEILQVLQQQMDMDRARTNQTESHVLNLDRVLQEYVRNTSAEIQNLRTECDSLKQMLESVLDLLGDEDDDEENEKEGI